MTDNTPKPRATSQAREPDWLNADACIENMQIAYDDALEDGDETPVDIVDIVVGAGDLGVLINLAKWAVWVASSRQSAGHALPKPALAEGESVRCSGCGSVWQKAPISHMHKCQCGRVLARPGEDYALPAPLEGDCPHE